MKLIQIVCLSISILVFAACKQDATTKEDNSSPEMIQESSPAPSLSEGHDYTILTDKIFHYKAAHVAGAEGQEQPFKDEWIDLLPNGKFKAGKLSKQTHAGQWSFNPDTKVLFLKPDNNQFKMSEWKVMYNNQMMVWVGTQTYGNNATQIQLVRSEVFPGQTPE